MTGQPPAVVRGAVAVWFALGGFLLPFALGGLRQASGAFALGFGVLALVGALTALGVTTRLRVWLTPPTFEAVA